ncbi:MAG TPA: hypothetical protein VG097_13595, partial [Gemmata sp.]|nr:hypothetical protein [Gemmata sp.]
RESLAAEITEVLEKDNLARCKLTDKTLAYLRDSKVPESVLSKLAPLKGKDYSQEEFNREIEKALNTDELERFKKIIFSQSNEVLKHLDLILSRCRMTPAQLYEDGLKKWKAVIAKYSEFHRPERSERTEEDTFGFELAYLRLLVQDDERVRAKANESAHQISNALRLTSTVLPFQPYSFTASVPYWSTGSTSFIGTAIAQSLASPFAVPEWKKEALEDIKWYVAETQFSPFAGQMRAEDGVTDPERLGGPWIRPEVKRAVLTAQGMIKAPSKPNPNAPSAPAPPLPKN